MNEKLEWLIIITLYMNTRSRLKVKNDNIKCLSSLAAAMLLIVAMGGCSFAITNQQPSPGGCTGEPHRVYC